jgi:peroxiredoxin
MRDAHDISARRASKAFRAQLLGAAGLLLTAVGLAVASNWALPAQAQIAVRNQGYVPYSEAPIYYRTRELTDPVAVLQKEIEAGKAELVYDEKDHGYLKSVLKLLKVPVASQTLVFSKTSFQYLKISPEHPRALYYNDDVYVGSVHDGKTIEIVSFDPMQGAVFYLVDEQKVDKPVFQRAELDCTQCHIAAGTRGVPGVLLRSVYPTPRGGLTSGAPSFITDQKSPLKERWGGWYVSGPLAKGSMANSAVAADAPAADPGAAPSFPLSPLGKTFDSAAYLAPTSDAVSLLVLAHQAQMHNLITLTNYQTRLALHALAQKAGEGAAAAPAPTLDALPEAARNQIQKPAEQLLRHLLFVNETPLGGLDAKQVIGASAFAREFAARGERDSKKRSLRDFDLHDRIFRYPLSYLIYSSAFDTLPEPAKGYVYHRLLQVLSGQDQSPDFAGLTPKDRQAILSILLETKPNLPEEWRDFARAQPLARGRPAARPLPGEQLVPNPFSQRRSMRNTDMKHLLRAAAVAAILSAGGAAFAAEPSAAIQPVVGQWDAVLSRNGVEIPFRLDIKGDGSTVQGVFYDGFEPYDGTTSASFENGKLTLNAEHYLTTITATLNDGKLVGGVTQQNRESSAKYDFRATRHVAAVASAGASKAPSIAGQWIIPLETPSSKGEKAFRFVTQQRGDEVAASILRIDGDTGAYTGAYKDGKWVLSHFDGSRPGVIVVTPQADGTLRIQQQVDRPGAVEATKVAANNEYATGAQPDGRYAAALTAYRTDSAQAKALPAPEDFLTHTTARDPNETFAFNFPDINGKLISNDDPRFKGKVVLAIVTGTWCPNCHDEAQYLVKLDKKYRDKGLAIVALSFEEPEQQAGFQRAKAFINKYGVKYTYLFPGAPAEMWEKVPQLNHLDTWPATVFIDRSGKVAAVHSGFASPASGAFHAQLEQEFTTRIEELLAQNAKTNVAAAAPVATAKLD